MEQKVREAVTSLRAEVYDEAELITVTASDLRVLLGWAEGVAAEEDADTCELFVGDRVELKEDYLGKFYTRAGARGKVNQILSVGPYGYPYEIIFDNYAEEYPVQFIREELRKVAS